MTPYFSSGGVMLYHGDSLEIINALETSSVDCFVDDYPYYKVLGDSWDNAWDSPASFLAWLGTHFQARQRVLRGNGSIWSFAFPSMAAHVEVEVGKYFNVLNNITWDKKGGVARRSKKSELRRFISMSERIIFAEQYGADNRAKGEAGYEAQCDKLRGFVFEPLRAYFDGERLRAGVTNTQIVNWHAAHGFPKFVTARHTFTTSQWHMPTPEAYRNLRNCFNELGKKPDGYLVKDYAELRKDYAELRKDYTELRRPFAVTAADQYTDVWRFNSSEFEGTLHPAQKPIALMRHIVRSSTRPGAVIVDGFMGSGTTGAAVVAEGQGRRFIGIEKEERYCEVAAKRITAIQETPYMFAGAAAVVRAAKQAGLF